MSKISARLSGFIDSLPLKDGLRILEIGCGSGAAAREIIFRTTGTRVLGIDRSLKAIEQAAKSCSEEIKQGRMLFVHSGIENFELPKGEKRFDFAFAVRVGALDGRHPEIQQAALSSIFKALKKGGKLYIDGGDPLKEVVWQSV